MLRTRVDERVKQMMRALGKAGVGACLALYLLAGAAPAADFRVSMRDGSEVSGQIMSFIDGMYEVRTGGGMVVLNVRGVARIDVTGPAGQVRQTFASAIPGPSGVPAAGGTPTFRVALSSGEQIVGAITAFDDGVYTVVSGRGSLKVPVRAVSRIEVSSLASRLPAGGASGAGAGEGVANFQLSMRGGAEITGPITAFDDGVYTVVSERGNVLVPVRSVTKIALLGYLQPRAAGGRNARQAGPALQLAGRLRIAGSNSMGEAIVPMLLESYAGAAGSRNASWLQSAGSLQRNFRATNIVGTTLDAQINRRGVSAGLAALANSEADIGMVSRQLTTAEIDLLRQAGFPDPTAPGQEHVVGLSGIVVLVHPSNPVKTLSLDQIAGIFSGRLRSWGDVGGRPRRIRVFTPPEASGEMDNFKQNLLNSLVLSPTARRLPSSSELSDTISSDPSAIGFADYAFIRNAAAVAIKGTCGISHRPSEFSIQTEEYPLSGRLLFYSKPQTEGTIVDSFLKYVVSDEAQKRLSDQGAVSLLPTIADRDDSKFADQSGTGAGNQQLLANLRDVVNNGQRVSLTFRFATGTSNLDARGNQDIGRLATFLQNYGGNGKRVALLGFADSRGNFGRNQRLSQQRARIVANRLKGLGITADLVAGFSSLAPVVCETSRAMMAKNRRVEVWLF